MRQSTKTILVLTAAFFGLSDFAFTARDITPSLKRSQHHSAQVQTPTKRGPDKRGKDPWVVCRAPLQMFDYQKRTVDQGQVQFHFQVGSADFIRNIQISSQFRKISPQSITAAESRAQTYGMIRAPSSSRSFLVGSNGNCGFELSMDSLTPTPKITIGINCGYTGAVAKGLCQLRR